MAALEEDDHALIRMKKDSEQLRHYVVLSSAVDNIFHFCLTPARIVKKVDFSAREISMIFLYEGGLPRSVRRSDVFLDADSSGVKFHDFGTWPALKKRPSRCETAIVNFICKTTARIKLLPFLTTHKHQCYTIL